MTFEDIMKYNSPYNQINFNELIEQIKSNNIVPYIGAGMSMLFENVYTSWSAFLDETFDKFIDSSKKNTFDNLGYEEKADYLYNEIGEIQFNNFLTQVFSPKSIDGTSAKFHNKAVYLIPLIFKKSLLLTTNYDKVLEKMYQLHNELLTTLHPGHKEALNNSLRTNELLLYKIHGDISESTSIILTTEQYDRVYQDNDFKKE